VALEGTHTYVVPATECYPLADQVIDQVKVSLVDQRPDELILELRSGTEIVRIVTVPVVAFSTLVQALDRLR